MELHRKVSSLIEYLKQKWTYHDQRIVSFDVTLQSSRIGMIGVATLSALHTLVFLNSKFPSSPGVALHRELLKGKTNY